MLSKKNYTIVPSLKFLFPQDDEMEPCTEMNDNYYDCDDTFCIGKSGRKKTKE